MSIKFKNKYVTDIYTGNTKIDAIYCNNKQIWHSCYPDGQQLTFSASQDGESSHGNLVFVANDYSDPNNTIYYYGLNFTNKQIQMLPLSGHVAFEYFHGDSTFANYNLNLEDIRNHIGKYVSPTATTINLVGPNQETWAGPYDLYIGGYGYPPDKDQLIIGSNNFYNDLAGRVRLTIYRK